jgi:hypothetical protein
MKMLVVFECLVAFVPIFLGGCTVYDAHGQPSTVVPIMGTDEYGNPTMTWVSASALPGPVPSPGSVVASEDYDYEVDPIVYPDDFEPGYLEAHGFYFHHGHYHRWHGGGPRYWAAHHGALRGRNGHTIQRNSVTRRLPVRTTVAVHKK